jgi:hypothetical protein
LVFQAYFFNRQISFYLKPPANLADTKQVAPWSGLQKFHCPWLSVEAVAFKIFVFFFSYEGMATQHGLL